MPTNLNAFLWGSTPKVKVYVANVRHVIWKGKWERGLFKVTEKIHSFFGGKWLPFGFSAVVVNDLVDTDSDIAALALFF